VAARPAPPGWLRPIPVAAALGLAPPPRRPAGGLATGSAGIGYRVEKMEGGSGLPAVAAHTARGSGRWGAGRRDGGIDSWTPSYLADSRKAWMISTAGGISV
jgi:hypothetical protein